MASTTLDQIMPCCAQEDELYDLQFGEAFAAQAMDPNDRRNVLRDDYALEIAGRPLRLKTLLRCRVPPQGEICPSHSLCARQHVCIAVSMAR